MRLTSMLMMQSAINSFILLVVFEENINSTIYIQICIQLKHNLIVLITAEAVEDLR